MKSCSTLLLFLFGASLAQAQTASYNFRQVTAKDGLADGVARTITQDKYGYLWFGTQSALNRYDGYRVTNFVHNPNDSFSVPADFIRSSFCDNKGTLWFGYSKGLYLFDYNTSHFIHVPASGNIRINTIIQADDSTLFLFTSKGLATLNTNNLAFSLYHSERNLPLLQLPVNDGCMAGNKVYMAADTGIIVFSLHDKSTSVLSFNGGNNEFEQVAVDRNGTVWASNFDKGGHLYRLGKGEHSFRQINSLTLSPTGDYDNILDLLVDHKNRLWIATIWNGLIQMNTDGEKKISISNDYRLSNSLPENHINEIFEDSQGFLWLGMEGSGVSYFHPDNNLFHILIPQPFKLLRPHIWSRTITEDKDGNFWMGTGTGLVKENKTTHAFTVFQNNEITGKKMLHNNSIRSLLCDDRNDIWIGTADGVNKYEKQTSRMFFYAEKDSLPKAFYWCLMQDKEKTIWAGGTKGLYYKKPGDKRFYSLHYHTLLKPYAGFGTRSLLEDSRGNLWIGLNGKGLILWNRQNNTVHYWNDNPDGNGAGKMISSITEDKTGVIWFSSYFGIASYHYSSNTFTRYADVRAMGSLQVSALQADAENRLWLATTKGLLMLDKERKSFKHFGTEDGLPDIQFSDQAAYKLGDGRFVYPTYDGFVFFNPLAYKDQNVSANILISSIMVGDKPIVTAKDIREQTTVQLASDQNFFSIELTSFNYTNPKETWYAYKLQGFDKNWIYTRNRLVNYTNVPGGRYTFYYKASSDPNNWKSEVKQFQIIIDTVFYKSVWFWVLLIILTAALLYWLYRNRIKHARKVHFLKSKAQLLEKEKALVMYESLKQQLNPHFLFNSLTSLSSLIQSADKKEAAGFLDSLSKTYRYILKSRDNETVSLGDEIQFAENYVRLQKTRFEKGFNVSIEISREDYSYKIVPVTLQNLIENAMKHNIIDEESPLQVNIFKKGDFIVVQNNLQKKKFVETSNKHGLENLKSLYRYLTDTPVEITETGQLFTIKIPLL